MNRIVALRACVTVLGMSAVLAAGGLVASAQAASASAPSSGVPAAASATSDARSSAYGLRKAAASSKRAVHKYLKETNEWHRDLPSRCLVVKQARHGKNFLVYWFPYVDSADPCARYMVDFVGAAKLERGSVREIGGGSTLWCDTIPAMITGNGGSRSVLRDFLTAFRCDKR